jgi:hypothetical protein
MKACKGTLQLIGERDCEKDSLPGGVRAPGLPPSVSLCKGGVANFKILPGYRINFTSWDILLCSLCYLVFELL